MNEQFYSWGLILLGLIALTIGGEILVRGASTIAALAKIPPLVIGLTVVAFGTSAPELGVSLQAATSGAADVAVGNVVGSNIFNVLFILGVSGLITPLVVSSRLIRLDVPLMIGASLLVWMFASDGRIGRWDGVVLFVCLLGYIAFCIGMAKREASSVKAEFAGEYGGGEQTRANYALPVVMVAIGLVLLGLGAKWLVGGAVAIATWFGVSELVIGLTIVAAGTSLPEVVTSVVASVRGEREIAVGNVVGSNLFNLACVLGVSAMVAPEGVPVSDTAIRFDMPVMVVVAAACLPVFFTGSRISRGEGAVFLLGFVAYTTYVIMAS
ncbi:calcium/sodium antiporter [Rhodopirellula sallentina]|uniref:Na+/Ca+ antiporter, CaCA family n=1 Tax=Rhodopirellula sallentina SM41 TaxID=1263870 RepID=M5UA62_9BACT|nr:calcium/sodium antiporter [Rhodopirellula sallentina]EMI52908.1 Na+/Ca+ antiporter, CaCA family [Rhodopirellula sallentina SM41]